MPRSDRRAFLLSTGVVLGCARRFEGIGTYDASAPSPPASSSPKPAPRASYPLFDAFPALEKRLPRIALASFPAPIEPLPKLLDDRLFVKRDDELTPLYGGGKVRKLELFFGAARATGKRVIVTFGGVGSNQAVAAALLGRSLGFAVKLYLAPQPPSSLVRKNLGAAAAAQAELRLFPSVIQAQAAAAQEFPAGSDAYLVSPGGTTPLGTLGFVNAGLELAADVRAGVMPAPKRVYVALGLGGTAVGLGIGCALGGLATEIVAVRASNPTTVDDARLRAIFDETIAFASLPSLDFARARPRIDGRFVGGGYGAPTKEGDAAVDRARVTQGLALDPVYTGKAMAALLTDAAAGASGPLLFWNTTNARSVPEAPVPKELQHFLR